MWRILPLLFAIGAAPVRPGGGSVRPALDTPGGGSPLRFDDDVGVIYGTGSDVSCEWDTASTPDSFVCAYVANNAGLAIGYLAATSVDGIAIGNEADSQDIGGIAIGDGAKGCNACYAMGAGAVGDVSGSANIMLGGAATTGANTDYATAIGFGADIGAASSYSIAIGDDATVDDACIENIVIGNDARAWTDADQAVIIGDTANADSDDCTAVGQNAGCWALGGTALGSYAQANAGYSVAIGEGADVAATAQSAIAIGYIADANEDYSIALGERAVVALTHEDSVAIGRAATTTAAQQFMIGSAAHPLDVVLHGQLTFTDTVWDDITVPTSAITRLGTTDPDWANLNGGLYALAFDGGGTRDEEVFFVVQVPHSYKEGTDLEMHIHWGPEDGTAGNVRWCMEYSWQNIEGGAFPASTTVCVNAAADGTADAHQYDDIADITGTSKTISSMLVCRLYREATDAADTYNNLDAWLWEMDFHFQKDTVGSATETTK